ncbi:metal-dependent transcriptional regulator [Dellaglioa sp. BT-FLS60]
MTESISKNLYLQTILELSSGNDKISNKQIADHLNVSPSSVSDMLSKLQEQGTIILQPYYGVTLTEKGKKTAIKLIRSHRLFEIFLSNKLHLSISETHMNADNLDHDADEKMINALEIFLDYPTHCPHGLLIPDADYNYAPVSLKTIFDSSIGNTIEIDSFTEDLELLQYIELINIPIHSQWIIINKLPFDGQIILTNVDDHREIQLTPHAGKFIFIQILSK